uniref:Rh50 protein n=1 Tax=Homo sapiens TaxID=9606 RepID=Q16417_HUMAN
MGASNTSMAMQALHWVPLSEQQLLEV